MANGHGGRRVGAGRPRNNRGVVLAMSGSRVGHGTTEATPALETPPEGLSPAKQKAWLELAPLAIARGTLTAEKLPGFLRLVKCAANEAELDARLDVLGRTTAEASDLLKRWEKAVQLLNSALQQFDLTAFGKPDAGIRKKSATPNPFAAVSGR